MLLMNGTSVSNSAATSELIHFTTSRVLNQ